jgi:ribosomal-protein-alanine N-acetyltransferase
MNIKLEPLLLDRALELFKFEMENRDFFETLVMSRGDDYYSFDYFKESLQDLLKEQELGIGQYFLIVNEEGTIVGRINLFNIEQQPTYSADLGYRVGRDFLRKGIATKSVKLLINKLESVYKEIEIRAKTTTHNVGSQKILERSGFMMIEGQREKVIVNDFEFNFLEYYWNNIYYKKM